jgi:hypothetical protein
LVLLDPGRTQNCTSFFHGYSFNNDIRVISLTPPENDGGEREVVGE